MKAKKILPKEGKHNKFNKFIIRDNIRDEKNDQNIIGFNNRLDDNVQMRKIQMEQNLDSTYYQNLEKSDIFIKGLYNDPCSYGLISANNGKRINHGLQQKQQIQNLRTIRRYMS